MLNGCGIQLKLPLPQSPHRCTLLRYIARRCTCLEQLPPLQGRGFKLSKMGDTEDVSRIQS